MSKDFKIKRATVTYIYSFLPVSGDMIYDQKVIECFYDPTKNSNKPSLNKNDKNDPRNRKGLSAYLALNIPMGYKCSPVIETKLNKMDIKIYPLFRFFSHGCSLTFQVVANKKNGDLLSAKEAYSLMHLVSNEKNESAKTHLNIFGENQTLFSLFRKEVNSLFYDANIKYFEYLFTQEDNKMFDKDIKIIKAFLNEKDYFSLLFNEIEIQKLSNIISENSGRKLNKSKDGKDIRPYLDFIKSNIISLLCIKEDILRAEDVEETNVPWIITNLELEKGDVLDKFCNDHKDLSRAVASKKKLKEIRPYEKILSHFLFRLVDEDYDSFKVEPTYDTFETITKYNGFNNIYLDSRLYMHASRRSILTITENNFTKPASYLLPTLFDICELVHTRWQALIAINIILDRHIRVFSNHKIDEYRPSQKLWIVLNLLKKSIANIENPISYVVSGDALREIHNLLIDTFKLKELESSSIKKSEMLYLIYNIGVKYSLTK